MSNEWIDDVDDPWTMNDEQAAVYAGGQAHSESQSGAAPAWLPQGAPAGYGLPVDDASSTELPVFKRDTDPDLAGAHSRQESPSPAQPEPNYAPPTVPRSARPAPSTPEPREPQEQTLTVTIPTRPAQPKPAQPKSRPAEASDGSGGYRMAPDSRMVKNPEKGIGGAFRRMSRRFNDRGGLAPEQLVMNVKQPLARPMIVAVCSHAGGVGKSAVAAACGQTLATHRRDRVIAIDAAEAAGGLSQRLEVTNKSTIQTLLANLGAIRRWSDARQHTSQGRSGLELLRSGDSIADENILTAEGYRQIVDVLTANDTYNLLVVDCDAGVTGPLMDAVLESADALIVPVAGMDGVSGGMVAMNRLIYLAETHPAHAGHYRNLVANTTVAINHLSHKSTLRDAEVEKMFLDKVGVRAVVPVPFDPTLKDGGEVDVMRLSKSTENAFLKVAAEAVTSLRRAV